MLRREGRPAVAPCDFTFEDDPVFVVGCGRSGTTLLRLMLDSHPVLAIPGESNFIRSLWDGRRRYWSEGFFHPDRLLEDVVSDPNLATWGVPAEAIREAAPSRPDVGFADVVAAPFRAYATLHGKPRWGDKTPIYVLSMRDLAVLFPRARFVHLIRDGRNVALSYLEMRSFKGGICPGLPCPTPHRMITWWRCTMKPCLALR